jgi:hydrogenase expression/formation protein HypC
MRVKKVEGDFAQVASGRLLRRVNVQMLPGLKAGEYVIVHAGFAIEKLDPQEAGETLKVLDGMNL